MKAKLTAALLSLCLLTGCNDDAAFKKGVYKSDSHSFEIISHRTLKINGKPYHYRSFCNPSVIRLPNSTYYLDFNDNTVILSASEIEPGDPLPDMSGEYQWQEPKAEIDQSKQLKISGDVLLNRFNKLKDVHTVLNQKINEKTQKLKDTGVKSASDLSPETKPIAQELVALCKERDKIIKAEDATLNRLKTIEYALSQDIPDKTLDEILANLPEKKSPAESIEVNDILNTQLQGK